MSAYPVHLHLHEKGPHVGTPRRTQRLKKKKKQGWILTDEIKEEIIRGSKTSWIAVLLQTHSEMINNKSRSESYKSNTNE